MQDVCKGSVVQEAGSNIMMLPYMAACEGVCISAMAFTIDTMKLQPKHGALNTFKRRQSHMPTCESGSQNPVFHLSCSPDRPAIQPVPAAVARPAAAMRPVAGHGILPCGATTCLHITNLQGQAVLQGRKACGEILFPAQHWPGKRPFWLGVVSSISLKLYSAEQRRHDPHRG